MTLAIVLAGLVVVALIGFFARRRPAPNLAEWTIAGRRFGAATLWFLQVGDIFTTYTFLGIAGLTFVGGVAVLYSMPFEGLGFIGLYFLAPRLWRYARDRNLLTQADYLESVYRSKLLGIVAAISTILFTLPYLQIQLVGLGSIVQLVTGSRASGVLAIVVGGVLIVAFMLWSGLRGIAYQAYFKDVLLIMVMAILVVVIPLHFLGGIPQVFQKLQQVRPAALTVHPGPYDGVWFLTSLGVSAITIFFLAQAATYPVIYSAKSARAAQRNYVFLPLYFLVLAAPIIIGFTATLVLHPPVRADTAVLVLAARALPPWLLGVVGVAGCTAALVPSAHLLLTISTHVARNLARVRSQRAQHLVNHAAVVVATAAAVAISIVRPDLIALLALLSYAGGVQLAPATAAALIPRRPFVRPEGITAGLVVGAVVVILMTAANVDIANINVGIIGLACNLAVVAVVEAVLRLMAPRPRPAVALGDEERRLGT
jgi:SSS family solute:Na+ symporter